MYIIHRREANRADFPTGRTNLDAYDRQQHSATLVGLRDIQLMIPPMIQTQNPDRDTFLHTKGVLV